ncbi:MAG: translation initiation factor IF-2 [Chloroflexi bacterium]|nr:MAG: translation initiation factor IF-2 [Chloroflexota bacterium]
MAPSPAAQPQASASEQTTSAPSPVSGLTPPAAALPDVSTKGQATSPTLAPKAEPKTEGKKVEAPPTGSAAEGKRVASSATAKAAAQPSARAQAVQSAPSTRTAPKRGAPAVTDRPTPSATPVRTPPTETRPTEKPAQAPARPAQKPATKPAEPVTTQPVVLVQPPAPAGPVAIPSVLNVRELALLLKVPSGDLIKRLMTMGIFATINQALDYDTATLIAEEFQLKTKHAEVPSPKEETKPTALRELAARGAQEKAQLRSPVVTVLGHVDHGKTSLLDAIRNAKVAAGEAGGITQHIGAYQAERNGRKITFLDTPGHEAFTAMRARGAQVTDVAVLVVAADDGVMPQTKEAINHVRAANVPMIVALNKIDRETADQDRVMRQLADANVLVEQWGGDTPLVPVSAKKIVGIDELLEMILLVADLAELKANPEAPAVGTVIEAQVDRSRGPVATLLVQNGTLRQNDYIVVEGVSGRVRAMFDDKGNRLSEAGPSMPVLVLGLPTAPVAGGIFRVAPDERSAKQSAEEAAANHAQGMKTSKTLSLDELYTQMEAGKMHDLNIVLKADVQGSLEPIRNSIEKLSTDNLKVRLLHEGLGNISESDVSLALASQAIVIGFHVDADPAARKLANSEGVDIRLYDIIYELIDDVDKALNKVNKRAVAGCAVTEGKALRAGMARVLRGGKPVFDGRVASLKRFTEDVREVATGFEGGVMLEGFETFQVGDVIEFYHKEKEE